MKKISAILILIFLIQPVFAQRVSHVAGKPQLPSVIHQPEGTRNVADTLTSHFTGTVVLYTSDLGGYVSGHNGYLDKAKMQLFDAGYGVTGPGYINSILFWFGHKEGNPNDSITATIWDDVSGTPGNILASVNIPFSAIDTAVAHWVQIVNAPDTAFYNTVAIFATPVPIPASGNFWAGFAYTYVAGDTLGLLTTSDANSTDGPGFTGDFHDASTHTWEQWDDGTFYSFNDGTTNSWQLDIAQAIFPAMDFTVGVNETNSGGVALMGNYPNPFHGKTLLSYRLEKGCDVNISVTDLTGREILTCSRGIENPGSHTYTLDASSLNAGAYLLTLHTQNGAVTRMISVME